MVGVVYVLFTVITFLSTKNETKTGQIVEKIEYIKSGVTPRVIDTTVSIAETTVDPLQSNAGDTPAVQIVEEDITIEDTDLPRPFREPQIRAISKSEMAGKLKAAVSARNDASFAIVARTISFEQEGTDKAIERIKVYSQTGADAIFLAGIPGGKKDIIAAHKATHLPIIIARLSQDVKDHEFLCENNVRFALNGQPAFRAAIKTTFEVMEFLKEGGDISEIEDRLVSNKLFEQITRVEQYKSLQEKFLS